jgi:hypothetical protein
MLRHFRPSALGAVSLKGDSSRSAYALYRIRAGLLPGDAVRPTGSQTRLKRRKRVVASLPMASGFCRARAGFEFVTAAFSCHDNI